MRSDWTKGLPLCSLSASRRVRSLRTGMRMLSRRVARGICTVLPGTKWVLPMEGTVTTADNRKIIVANPHGFCVGVVRAVSAAEKACELFPGPVYCLNDIVHNAQVVESLRAKGIVFVTGLAEVPGGGTVLFSAHGVSPEIRDAAEKRRLRVIDATCPFVHKVHAEVRKWAGEGCTVLLIGSAGHDEIRGVRGEAPESVIVIEGPGDARSVKVPDPARVAVATQTTLSVAEVDRVMEILKKRFPGLLQPERQDVCYATRNRQLAVSELARASDMVFVLGSRNSANSRRLVEVAAAGGKPSRLVQDMDELKALNLDGVSILGITSGASTPEAFLDEVLASLAGRGFASVERIDVVKEGEGQFKLPAPLDGQGPVFVCGLQP